MVASRNRGTPMRIPNTKIPTTEKIPREPPCLGAQKSMHTSSCMSTAVKSTLRPNRCRRKIASFLSSAQVMATVMGSLQKRQSWSFWASFWTSAECVGSHSSNRRGPLSTWSPHALGDDYGFGHGCSWLRVLLE